MGVSTGPAADIGTLVSEETAVRVATGTPVGVGAGAGTGVVTRAGVSARGLVALTTAGSVEVGSGGEVGMSARGAGVGEGSNAAASGGVAGDEEDNASRVTTAVIAWYPGHANIATTTKNTNILPRVPSPILGQLSCTSVVSPLSREALLQGS